MHDTKKLPKWAQQMFADKNDQIDRLEREKERMEKAHDVLIGREWFTIPNPINGDGPEYRSLFVLTYRDPEPSKQALEIKTPPLVKRWWMRPICLLLGHHWHWTRWSAVRHYGDIRNHLPDAGFGADKFCRRCGAESYRCEDATSIGFQRVGNQWDTDIVRTIKP